MAPATRPSKPGAEEPETPSNNLWVGNLAVDVTDSDLMDLFAQFGALDSVTTYSSRSYAFVFFKRAEDAAAAKEALQGTLVHANPLKIEFARPAKPCKNLWVGGISSSLSREELEEEFVKFGKLDDFKFLRDRNTAFVEYTRLEDASQALRNMNGKRLGGDQLRVDYLRSQSSRREQWPDYKDAQFQPLTTGPGDSQRRQQYTPSSGGRKGENQPSKVLWVGYPPSVQIDEQMLHNAMILFGEIERIKSFPSRHYSFVEFRSVDEARRAKEGLQGRLFNDPRITIMFSSSGQAPGKDYSGPYPGGKGPRADMLFNEHPFQPLQIDMFGHNRPMMANNFPGALPPSGGLGPNAPMRPPHGRFDPLIPGSEFTDLASRHHYQDGNSKNLMGPNWKRPSPPTSGIISSPGPGVRPHTRPASVAWDALDTNQFQRDSKRSRIDSPLSVEDPSYPLRMIEDHGLGLDSSYGLSPGGPSGLNVQGKSRLSPSGVRISVGGSPDNGFIWRGTIAKGGTHVCQARCVPIEGGIGNELPEIVNCSARTGLDMLTKHYAEAIGFDIVFFLPDSEDDFASYTEFLHYLGAKNRAGVAKFDDGMTLFLVPPSNFLKNVLKVEGPERLYGVVLKFAQQVPGDASMHQQSHLSMPPSQFIDRQQIPSSHAEFSVAPMKEEHILPKDYNRVLNEDSMFSAKPMFPHTSESSGVLSATQDYASRNSASVSQAGVALTPELIATLATLLPGNAQTSGPEGAQMSLARPSFPALTPSKVSSPGWRQDQQISDHTGHALPHFGGQFNPHEQNVPQYQPYPPVSNASSHSAPQIHANTQILDSFTFPSHGGQFTGSSHLSQQYLAEAPFGNQNGFLANGANAPGLHNVPVSQQLNNSGSGPTYGPSSQSQTLVPSATEKVNPEYPNQMEQLQSALLGAGQSTSNGEADKNTRYQSTLQFAANLLQQLQQQQQQQQLGNQARRESGSQQ